jgi:hypothetical protein
VRTRDRPEDQEDRDERTAGRDRVRQQRASGILRELVRHDAGSDHGRDEQRRPEALGHELARERYLHALGPHDLRSFVWSARIVRSAPNVFASSSSIALTASWSCFASE